MIDAAPTIPGPLRTTRVPNLQLPAGSCDCHAHLFGPQRRYPYHPDRRYTPPDALLEDYVAMLRTLGVERGVLVQPSVYMTDNRLILDTLAREAFSLRAVAVVDATVSDAELRLMDKLGVRGLRLNLRHSNGVPADIAPRLAARIASLGWHLQFRIDSRDFVVVEPWLATLPVDVVVDHIGQVPVAEGVNGPAFAALRRLLDTGRCWVKLSAPMRMSDGEYPYADVLPFVQALVRAAPERLLWATDWPHTTLTKRMPNDGDLVDLLADWLPTSALRQQVLVDNPARLYGF